MGEGSEETSRTWDRIQPTTVSRTNWLPGSALSASHVRMASRRATCCIVCVGPCRILDSYPWIPSTGWWQHWTSTMGFVGRQHPCPRYHRPLARELPNRCAGREMTFLKVTWIKDYIWLILNQWVNWYGYRYWYLREIRKWIRLNVDNPHTHVFEHITTLLLPYALYNSTTSCSYIIVCFLLFIFLWFNVFMFIPSCAHCFFDPLC